MIQRIQSIWLLLAAIVILILLFIPTVGAISDKGEYILYASGLKQTGAPQQTTNIPLLAFTVLVGLISLANIFNFRNRKLQIRIASVNIILILGLSFWMSQLVNNVDGLKELNIEPGIFLPLLGVIFSALAIRGIKKDEKLVRSADRLR